MNAQNNPFVGLDDIRLAAERIRARIRRTPVLDIGAVRHSPQPAGSDADIRFKLECLQVTGSFKARGASNKLLSLAPETIWRGIVTASGGNHGLAIAYAGWTAGAPATIFLPHSTPAAKAEKLKHWGAEVVWHGAVWDEANAAALDAARQHGLAYIHPFADPAVIAGQGTLGLEILEQVRDANTLIVAIGGGGLISGVAMAAKALKPGIRIVGVEPIGAPTLLESLKAGELVTLDRIETAAGTLAPRRSMPINLSIVAATVDRIVLVSDEEMRAAARWLWFEMGIAAELSGAAALATLTTGRYAPAAREVVVPVICGAGTDGIG